MTIAMQLEEKGRKSGLLEGKYEAQRETIIKLFKKAGFNVNQIADYLDLEKNFVEKILQEARLIK